MTSATVKPGPGRDETYWTAVLDQLPLLADPPSSSNVLLLAPHPDVEVLACGGLLQRWNRHDTRIDIWMVTDGEACFGDAGNPQEIAERRHEEARTAHARLGIDATVRWLGLPDSEVTQHRQHLHEVLATHLNAISQGQANEPARTQTQRAGYIAHAVQSVDTILIAPLPTDGHPDHDCIGAVAYELAAQHKLLLLQYPLWIWHSGSSNELLKDNVVRIELSESEKIRKRDAIAAFASQTQPEHGPAVLPRSVLRHFRRPFEVLFVVDFRTPPSEFNLKTGAVGDEAGQL